MQPNLSFEAWQTAWTSSPILFAASKNPYVQEDHVLNIRINNIRKIARIILI